MTSSSRADAAALLLLIASGCAPSTTAPHTQAGLPAATPETAPDAPQPAIEEPGRRPPNAEPKYGRIELVTVQVRRIDEELAKLAGREFVRTARAPVAVEATTNSELPPPLGASSPVLIINGQPYPGTWFVRPNRLIAFIADRASLRARNTAEAMWIGGGESTRSLRPIPFKPAID